MKIYIVTVEPFPNGMAASGRIICYAKGLIAAGIECEVIVTVRTERYGDKPNNTIGEGKIEGISFRYIGGTPLRSSSVLCRKFNDILDEYKTIHYLKKQIKKTDVILTYMRERPFNLKILNFAKKNNIKVIRDLCEYPFGTGKESENIQRKRNLYLKHIFPLYSGVICISDNLVKLAKYNGIPDKRIIKIPIMIDISKWDFNSNPKYDIAYPYIFHSGTLHQQKDGIISVLHAFAIALPQLPTNIKYLFTGNLDKSPDKDEILSTIQKLRLDNHIQFLGYLTFTELIQYMKGASAFIINKQSNLQNQYCFATKLGEYLLSGNPVITTNVGEATNYLEHGKSAYILQSNTVNELAQAIISIFSDKNTYTTIGLKGKDISLQNFSCLLQGKILARFIKNMN